MIPFIILGVLIVPPLFVALALARAAGEMDDAIDSWDDVFCPHCDSDDLDDWGEPGWWSCRACQMMFEIKEPTR